MKERQSWETKNEVRVATNARYQELLLTEQGAYDLYLLFHPEIRRDEPYDRLLNDLWVGV